MDVCAPIRAARADGGRPTSSSPDRGIARTSSAVDGRSGAGWELPPKENLVNRHLALTLCVIGALVATAVPALAAKGGKGGGHSGTGPPASSAWVSASPNPATVGGHVNLTGCGYSFAPVSVTVTQPNGSIVSFSIGTWSTGCLDTAYFAATQAGIYTIQVFQGTSSPVASTTVTAA